MLASAVFYILVLFHPSQFAPFFTTTAGIGERCSPFQIWRIGSAYIAFEFYTWSYGSNCRVITRGTRNSVYTCSVGCRADSSAKSQLGFYMTAQSFLFCRAVIGWIGKWYVFWSIWYVSNNHRLICMQPERISIVNIHAAVSECLAWTDIPTIWCPSVTGRCRQPITLLNNCMQLI